MGKWYTHVYVPNMALIYAAEFSDSICKLWTGGSNIIFPLGICAENEKLKAGVLSFCVRLQENEHLFIFCKYDK